MESQSGDELSLNREKVRRRKVDRAIVRLLEKQPPTEWQYWGKMVFLPSALTASGTSSLRFSVLFWALVFVIFPVLFILTAQPGEHQEIWKDILVATIPLLSFFGALAVAKWHFRYAARLSEQQGRPYLTLDDNNQIVCHLVNDLHTFEGFLVFEEGNYDQIHHIRGAEREPRTYTASLNYEDVDFNIPKRQEMWETAITQRQIGALYIDGNNIRYIISLHGSKERISPLRANYGVYNGRVFLD